MATANRAAKRTPKGQALDLDHRADGLGYRGMVQAPCNRAEGSRRRRAAQMRRGGVF